MNGLWIAKVK